MPRVGSGLLLLRGIILGSLLTWVLFGAILASLEGEADVGARTFALILVVVSTGDLLLISFFRDRFLKFDSEERLRSTYQQTFFVGFALAEAAVLFGFVGFFVTGRLWIYLLGVPFGLIGFALIAPTAANLRRLQNLLRATGSPLSIVAVLSRPFPQQPSASGPG